MRKIFAFFLFAILIGGYTVAADNYDFPKTSNGITLYYKITSSTSPYTVEVVPQNSSSPYYTTYPSGSLSIPSSVTYNSKTYSVTSIGDYAFYSCTGLTSVTIPSSITSISNNASFPHSSLTSITVNSSNTVYDSRNNCNAIIKTSTNTLICGCKNTIIPSTVTSIGDRAFANCSGLTTVSIPNSVRSIGTSAFSDCSGLTSATIGNSVESIGERAFYNCTGLTSITIPNSVTSIGYGAFCSCSGLTGTLTIPNSVTSIGNSAFEGCSGLTSVTIGNSVTSIGNSAFYGCSGLTSVYYNGNLAGWCGITFGNTSIYANPLYYAGDLYIDSELVMDLIIPETIMYINPCAFSGATCLKSVIIPNSVRSIGNQAFQNCARLTSVTIGNSVASVGHYAFEWCSELTNVYYTGDIASWCEIAFDGNYYEAATPLYYAKNFYVNNELIKDLIIPESITEILAPTFCQAKCFTSITIPSSVTSIGANAFCGCNMNEITIPSSVTSIGNAAFYNCTGLTTVNFNAINCTAGTSFSSILFNGCSSFTTLNIGNDVMNIPDYAFYNCSELVNIYSYVDEPPTIQSHTFSSGSNATIYVPCGSATAYSSATGWSNFSDIRERMTTYSISASSTNTEYGTASVTQQPNCTDGTAIIEATPNDGYAFAAWNDGNTDNPRTLTVTHDTVFTAEFELGRCLIASGTCGADGDNLTWELSCDSVLTISGSGAMANYGFDDQPWYSNKEKIHTVIIEDGVTSIGNSAFYGCSGLTCDLTIPENCISIGSNAFRGCSGLTGTLTIPNSVTSIGNYAFYNCTGLTSVTIGNSVREIGEYTFYGCQGLVSLSIGNSVENIGELAFGYCENISSIITSAFPPPTLDEHVFFYINIYDFDYSSITVWTPCDYVERYSLQWSNFSDIRGHFIYTLSVSSENPQQGTASVTQQPDCSNNGVAIIEATPNDGFAFAAWNDGNTENPRSVTVTSDTSFTASYGILYTIAVVSSNEDYGTVSGDGSYVEGSQIEISATPIEHYHFVQWNDGITENPRTITVTSDSTFTAEFAIDQFTVIVSANDEEMGAVSGGNTYDYGTETQISATANEHYHFVQWSDGNMENPRTITVTSDSTFTAEFAIDQFTVIVSANDEEMGAVDGNGTLNYGAEVQISATPIACHRFVQWNDGNTDNPRTITVTEDASYTANFETYQLEVSLSAEPIGCYGGTTNITNTVSNGTEPYSYAWSNGESSQNLNDVSAGTYSVTVTDAQTCTATASVTITQPDELTASLSATEIIYSGETSDITNTVSGGTVPYNYAWCNGATTQNLAGVSAGTYSVTVTDANGCTASTSIEIAGPQSYNIVANSNNDSYGSVSGGGTYDAGQTATLTATANEHYHFVQWNDGNTENPRSITVTSDSTFTATFAIDQHTITVVSSNETMGTVSGGGTFDYGATATLTATPAEGYEFVSWNDGNTENPRQITVIGDGIYVASFSEASQTTNYTITAVSANPNYGTVTGGGTYAEGTEVTLTATPNEGYEFVQWNDENTDNPRNITVTENAIYIATFAVVTIPTIYNEFSATACESYTWNDSIFNESGDYTQTFTATNSADSIVTLHLTIYPLPQPEITVDGILDACNPETASVTLSTEEFDSYIWSNGETTSSIEVTEPNIYYVEVVDSHGCHGVSEMAIVGYSSVLTEAPQIRLVGMSNSGKNVILWNVASSEGIAGYEIYREDNVANVYNCINRIERPNARSYIDLTSEPGARAYRYKICSFDECGGRSPMSDLHKTMHLTINRGVGTNWNLIWSHYEGLEFSTYKIYRGTSPRDMVMIGEIPSTLNSFTDLTNTLEEGMYYRVEIVTNNGAKNDEVSLSSNIVANEFVDNYTITAFSNNVNFGTVSGSGTYPAELDITLAAIPNAGYEFVSWSDGNTENPRIITVTENATYIATFAEAAPIENYTITVVSANPEYGTVTGGGTYPEGSVINIEAIANDGYRFVSWNDGNTDNPREITVMENATYEASFEEISPVANYTITAVSANPEYGTVTGGGTYAEGTVVSLTAEANDGYQFVQWSDGNTDNPREITVTGDAVYVALFAEVPPATTYTITAVSANPEYGTVTGGGTYAEGTVVTLTAEANEGYQFVQWSDGNTDNPREITVTGDAMYIATFAPATDISNIALPEISIFPNPTNDILNITSSEIISEIEIVNALGQVVYRTVVNADNVVCDVEGLTAGVYIVRIHGTDMASITQKKFIKE